MKKPLIVQKYGGSSLADPECLKVIARNIIQKKKLGYDLVVVVSAMGKTTDKFVSLAQQITGNPDRREMDMLLSVGERISIALLAIAINALGPYTAKSFTGSQIGIITDTNHTDAQIVEIKGHRIVEALQADQIVIVAGFQGVSVNKEITTLGRGGSDTTAVALAAALKAESCEILSDIDGIFTADPKNIKTAKIIEKLDYDTALAMSAAGAKMLHTKSVEFAKRYNVNLKLGSSKTGYIGTIVSDYNMIKGKAKAVVLDKDFILLSLSRIEKTASIARCISQKRMDVKIWQAADNRIFLGIGKKDLDSANDFVIDKIEKDLAVLSIVGTGIGLGTEVAEKFLIQLDKLGIKPIAIQSFTRQLKAVIPAAAAAAACERIHKTLL